VHTLGTSSPFTCSRCGQVYQLGSWCGNGPSGTHSIDRLPWLVVVEFESVGMLEEVQTHIVCQQCLGRSGCVEHSLERKLEELGVTVTADTDEGAQEQRYAGISLPTRASGFSAPVGIDLGALSRSPPRQTGSVGIALPEQTPSRGLSVNLKPPPLPNQGSSAGRVNVSASMPPPPTVSVAINLPPGAGASEPLLGRPARPARPERPARAAWQDRGRQGATLADGAPALAAIRKSLPTAAEQRRMRALKRFDEAMDALKAHVVALKRMRGKQVRTMLEELIRALSVAVEADLEKRNESELLQAAGVKSGWLKSRFTQVLVQELLTDTDRLWIHFEGKRIGQVLEILETSEKRFTAMAVMSLVSQIKGRLEHARTLASDVSVIEQGQLGEAEREVLIRMQGELHEQVCEIFGLATHAMLLDNRRSRDKILRLAGTSEYELETEFASHSSAPGNVGGGGAELLSQVGVIKTQQGSHYVDGEFVMVEGRQIPCYGSMPVSTEPVAHLSTGTSGTVVLPPSRIVNEFGCPYLVLKVDHTRTIPVECGTPDASKVQEVVIMATGMKMLMELREVEGLGRTWVYSPAADKSEEVYDRPFVRLDERFVELHEARDDERRRACALSYAHLSLPVLWGLLDQIESPDTLVVTLLEYFERWAQGELKDLGSQAEVEHKHVPNELYV